ncbi:phosphodiester glycosidase family protein [Methylosinus sp. LW4]|uniref:phosphodiester glycosidase family protein n=1 Tax=Methylosinus sp. LW4 TaxID=136993 RepID=UPI000361C21F|nr:phosphodiester glycosidase family protein [Methylosinus sp. LW4]
MIPLRRLLCLALLLFASPAAAAARNPCQDVEDAGASYTVCVFDARSDSIRLFLADAKDEVYGSFSALDAALAQRNEKLLFAMNAGMYDERRRPVGLYVEGGHMEKSANTNSGAGNFHMKPNGIFWVEGARAGVAETQRFLKERLHPAYATQSGPMLVVGGRINPRIHDTGTSMKIRNGVGVRDGHVVAFAIANQPVTFHAFAQLFRERLKCPDALFLDGSISALYAPTLARHDRFRPMGPIVGVVERTR